MCGWMGFTNEDDRSRKERADNSPGSDILQHLGNNLMMGSNRKGDNMSLKTQPTSFRSKKENDWVHCVPGL